MFEWVKKERGWFWYAGGYLTDWEKRVKVTNISVPVKKSFAPWSAKPKSTKKGDDSSKTCSDIVPFEGDLPPVGNTVLLVPVPTGALLQVSLGPFAPRPFPDAPPSSRTRGNKRKTSPPSASTTTEMRVCYF